MKSVDTASFATLLAEVELDAADRVELRRQVVSAAAPLAVVVALAAAWSAAAPLSGAVVAPARLKVELNRKTVQHQEGGIVRQILVRDGQKVAAGEPLLIIGDVRNDAALDTVRDQLRGERVRRARAEAETALAPGFTAPAGGVDSGEHVARESALFTSRRRMLDEHVAALEGQIRDARAQAGALESRIAATEAAAALSEEELAINGKLARQGFIQRTRLIALERTAADYRARVGEYRGEAAAVRLRIGELQSRIAQARNQYRSQAAEELRQVSAAIRELEQRLRPSEDQVDRQVVRAPVDGEVMSMRAMTVGTVVGPREPLLDVVPGREKIVVEARIRPQDIDHVRKDGAAEVRVSAFESRTSPLLPGKVSFVSPDRVNGADGNESWFVATVALDEDALEREPGLRLTAGMPAEVYVTTPERTLLDYMTKPLQVFASRSMREP